MDVHALARIAVVRKGRYLDHFPIAARRDWELLKLAEEVGEVAEAYDQFVDGPADPRLRAAFGEEMAYAAGFLAILGDAAGAPLDRTAPAEAVPAEKAWRRFQSDVGKVVKAYNRATGQSRPTGREPEVLRAELSAALAVALGSLDALAAAHGIDLAAAFDDKWGLPDLPERVREPDGAAPKP